MDAWVLGIGVKLGIIMGMFLQVPYGTFWYHTLKFCTAFPLPTNFRRKNDLYNTSPVWHYCSTFAEFCKDQ